MTRARPPKPRRPGEPLPPAGVRRGPASRGDAQWDRWLPLSLLVLAALWIHAPALRGPFLTDDYLFLDHVRHRALFDPALFADPIGNYFRPLSRQAHFWVWGRVGDESPLVFHVVNLGLLAVTIVLLYHWASRQAGARPAATAAAILALHAAADVPVLWASGAQDLLAVTLALAALVAHEHRRPSLSAALFALALLSKEVVVGLPAIAMLVGRLRGETWRAAMARTRWLWLVLFAWGALWLAMAAQRPVAAATTRWSLEGPLVALLQLGRVVLPASLWSEEVAWSAVARDLIPVTLALAGVALAIRGWRANRKGRPGPPRGEIEASRSLALAGAGWAVVGAVPIALVAHQWSLYFYWFAACGVAIALGGALSRAPRVVALATVAALGVLSSAERHAAGFATADDPWARRSHVNRFYLERAATVVERYTNAVLHARPTVPPNSTFFFSGIPAYVGWQAGDGPLIRWAYRDSSLRSYYVNAIDETRLARGPAFFFRADGADLVDETDLPGVWRRLALPLLLAGRHQAAELTLARAERQEPDDGGAWYLHGWTRLAVGDTSGAAERFARAGVRLRGPASPSLAAAERALAAGDSTTAARELLAAISASALDLRPHEELADLWLAASAPDELSLGEVYACLLLAPDRPASWYRWALLQLDADRLDGAYAALSRHDSLARRGSSGHPGAPSAWRRWRALQPGGSERERVR